MSKSHERLRSEVRGIRKLLEALARSPTPEQVYAHGLSAIHDIFLPSNVFVLLSEAGAKTLRPSQVPTYQAGWISDLAVPVFLDGEVVGQFMMHFDSPRGFMDLDFDIVETISGITSLALGLIRERHKSHQTLQLKSEAVAMAVHELRAPLTVIMGATFLLHSDRPQDREHAAEIIARNAKAQEQFICDLLNLSQLDAGRLTLRLAIMDLVSILEQVIDEIRPMAESAGVVIIAKLDRRIMVRGDAQRLWQIFWNLISNSLRFVASKGEIHVTASVQEGVAKVSVRDDGCGIPRERLLYIFDRFEQAHDRRAQTYDGFGLGLAVVKEFVSIMGGTVAAESEGHGKGATFTLRLPWVP